jgi:hypothetical protein
MSVDSGPHIVPSEADLRANRIRARRRTAMRVGLLVIAMTSATACIFDRGTYQGGGRVDHGATAATQSATNTAPTSTDTNNPPADGGFDAGLGAD